MNRVAAAALISIFVLGLCREAVAESPWPMFRHDSHHTGRTTFTGPGAPDTAWTFRANDAIAASPTIGDDGTIYVGAGGYYQGGGDSALYALNSDGSLKWLYKTGQGATPGGPAGIFSTAALGSDGAIYFGALDGNFYCLEDSGSYARLRWKADPGDWPIYSSPLVRDDGVVFFGCLNFCFYALSPDGTERFEYPTGWCIFSSPIFGENGAIHVGSKDHRLWTFRDSTTYPSVLWSHAVGTFYDGHLIDCSPALGDNGTIYFGSDQYGAFGQTPVPVDTSFWAVNPDGSRKWALYIGDGVESSPAIGYGGTIYFGSYNGKVYAVEDSLSYPRVKWTFQTGAAVDASPTVDGDGTIYIGSRDSTLYALRPDGSVKWSFKTGGGIESSVTIDDNGHIYFGSFDGKLYCLGTGAPDAGVFSVEVPARVPVNSIQVPTARISNFRGYPLSFTASCIIDNGAVVVFSDTVDVVGIQGGQYDYVTFAPFAIGPDTGVIYTVTVSTHLSGDDNPENDIGLATMVSSTAAIFACGDINGDGSVADVADLVYLVNFMFFAGPPPPFFEAADVNGDNSGPDIADLVYLVQYMFTGGPPPDCGGV